MALWTLQNAGAGNAAWRNQKRCQRGEAMADRTIIINQIRDEVATARADAAAQLRAVKVAQVRLATAESGFRREVQRSRANLGHPIEALNMVDLLVDARQQLVASIVAYNEAEFRLYVAMGFPPPMANPVSPPARIDERHDRGDRSVAGRAEPLGSGAKRRTSMSRRGDSCEKARHPASSPLLLITANQGASSRT